MGVMKASYIIIMIIAILFGSDGDENKGAEKSPRISSKKFQVAEGGKPIRGDEHPEKYKKNWEEKML